jgi:hypothetical protein
MIYYALRHKKTDQQIESNQFQCALCKGIFSLIRPTEEAEKEYENYFPGVSRKNRDVVCDDCWQIVKPK